MIKYPDYKKFQSKHNQHFYKKMEDTFKNFPSDKKYNRIYFDIEVNPRRFRVKVPNEIQEYFSWLRWHEYKDIKIKDYRKGICTWDGRDIRIGKVLNKLGQPQLLQTYQNSKDNTLKNVKDLRVVISRHPYDVIGMSTDRGWSTCIDLYDKKYKGKYLYSLSSDLRRGTLVAYLIRKGDENINNPLSRIRIPSTLVAPNKYRLYPDQKTYGTEVSEFRELINEWCNKVNEELNI